jgi:hypothetical protein
VIFQEGFIAPHRRKFCINPSFHWQSLPDCSLFIFKITRKGRRNMNDDKVWCLGGGATEVPAILAVNVQPSADAFPVATGQKPSKPFMQRVQGLAERVRSGQVFTLKLTS